MFSVERMENIKGRRLYVKSRTLSPDSVSFVPPCSEFVSLVSVDDSMDTIHQFDLMKVDQQSDS